MQKVGLLSAEFARRRSQRCCLILYSLHLADLGLTGTSHNIFQHNCDRVRCASARKIMMTTEQNNMDLLIDGTMLPVSLKTGAI